MMIAFSNRALRIFAGVAASVFVASCAGHGMTPAGSFAIPSTPQSISPADVPVAPMTKERGPAMQSSAIKPMDAIGPIVFQPISGTGSFVAAAQDGSVWVLSDQPAGPDKFIYHYVNGVWTQASGKASRLAVAPDGTLYAINSLGGAYKYTAGSDTFTSLGGGCSDITVAADGTVYVLSNGGGSDKAIWHYVNGNWTQASGSGVRIAGNWDTQTYTINNSGGSVAPGGFYILNSAGNIYYENTSGTFALLPGAASAIAPTKNAGIFVLAYPASAGDTPIFYFDLDAQNYTQPGGAAVSLSTNTSYVYAANSTNNLYYSPVTTTQGSLPTTFVNNSGITPAYFTIIARNPNNRADPAFYHVTASGQLVKFAAADRGSDGTADYNIPFPAPGTTFPLPLSIAARMFISLGTKFKTQINPDLTWPGQNGWSNASDANYNVLWDNFEYDYTISPDSNQPGMGINATEVQMFGLPLAFTLTGPTSGTQTGGFKPGARTAIMNALAGDSTFSSVLVNGTATGTNVSPIRAISMDQAIINANAGTAGVPHFSNTTYFDVYIASVWNFYKTHTLTAYTSAFGTYTASVNSSNQMVFTQTNKPDITFALPSTPDAIVGGGGLVTPCNQWGPPPPNTAPSPLFLACTEIGSMLSAAFNRTTLLIDQTMTRDYGGHPCPNPTEYYQGSPINLYSKVMHANSYPQLPLATQGAAYGFGFDDNCNQSSVVIDNKNPSALTITVQSF